jgi:hypothetical protein
MEIPTPMVDRLGFGGFASRSATPPTTISGLSIVGLILLTSFSTVARADLVEFTIKDFAWSDGRTTFGLAPLPLVVTVSTRGPLGAPLLGWVLDEGLGVNSGTGDVAPKAINFNPNASESARSERLTVEFNYTARINYFVVKGDTAYGLYGFGDDPQLWGNLGGEPSVFYPFPISPSGPTKIELGGVFHRAMYFSIPAGSNGSYKLQAIDVPEGSPGLFLVFVSAGALLGYGRPCRSR